jgi:hypothetical protein
VVCAECGFHLTPGSMSCSNCKVSFNAPVPHENVEPAGADNAMPQQMPVGGAPRQPRSSGENSHSGTGNGGFVWQVLERGKHVRGVRQPVPPPEVARAKVPGGWLVCTGFVRSLAGISYSGMTFYPDPDHLWDGNTLP